MMDKKNNFFGKLNKLTCNIKDLGLNLFYSIVSFWLIYMKKAIVLGITPASKLIVETDEGKTHVETKFEGFDIVNDLALRPCFDNLIDKKI